MKGTRPSPAPVAARPGRDASPSVRWFVALRPPPSQARPLAALAAALAVERGGRPLHADDLHLTLAFIGPRPLADGPSLRAALAGRHAPADAAIALPRLGSFDGRLLWAGPADAPAWLAGCAAEVRDALRAASIDHDARPFRPHLTLVRGASRLRDGELAALQSRFAAELAVPARGQWRLMLGHSSEVAGPRRYRWLGAAHDPQPTATDGPGSGHQTVKHRS